MFFRFLLLLGLLLSETGLYVHQDGPVVIKVTPKDRDIAMVFQNYALYPHKTVYENMAFGLRLRKFPKADIDKRFREAAEVLDITDYLQRKPKALSGGQRQQVALGRAIVRKPKVFLFDEPLSNLDAKMRVQMRSEISKLHTRLNTTMIYVTHDQTEAMTMGDRICVMKDGVIQQIDTPLELYDNPANLFVAGFIGTPPTNFFIGHLEKDGDQIVFTNDALRIPLPVEQNITEYVNRDIVLGIRPEHLGSDEAEHDPASPRIHAKISVVEPMGAETYLYLDVTRANSCIARINAHRQVKVGDDIDMGIHINSIHLFDKETSNRIF